MTDPPLISLTTSNRGKPLLVYSGYIHGLKKSTNKVKYWVCHSDGCLVTIHTNKNDEILKANGHHYHIPDSEQIELRNLRKKVKDRIQSETNSIPKTYEEELARSNLSATALTLAPVAVKIILFSSEWIFLDGTFDKCPKQFQQIYTIHGLKFQQNFPCVICLLSGKTADIYRQLFLELNDHATRLKMKFEPKHVMSDFEMSLTKVIKEKLPNVIHHGCFFHFTQSLHKHINSLGLFTAYLEDEDLRLACRSTMALALLPPDHLEEAFELLKNDSPEELIDFFKYFQNQWLKCVPKNIGMYQISSFVQTIFAKLMLFLLSKNIFFSFIYYLA
ncbi:unnamed protein product [Rotaria sp. Silwood1]|nr:unnamed protein product [Rotaria sp. Silwood1]CAF4845027.1 unnamed protein product [Rotaria sp. Silwood1]CAF4886364.1 unnamed protein product [Rotaria sp. Silwood1]